MLEAGDSLVTIKAFLGHASIVTTTVYAQITHKYLDDRGKPIPEKNIEVAPKPLSQALPFLYR